MIQQTSPIVYRSFCRFQRTFVVSREAGKLFLNPVRLQQAIASVLAVIDDADDVVRVAVDKEVVIQQVHLQNRLILAHGLDRHMLGADHLELGFFADVKLGRNGGGQRLLTQALGQAGLVLRLIGNGGAGGVDGAAHIAVPGVLLGAEEGAAAANGDLNHTAMPLFHREGHKRVGILPKIAVQLGNFLFGVLLDRVVEGHLFAGKCELHTIAPFMLLL